MTFFRPLMLAGLCLVSAQALAQWQWIGSDGRKVFSDRPPPADVPESRILKAPGHAVPAAATATKPAAATSRTAGRAANGPQYGDIKPEEPKKTAAPAPAASAATARPASAVASSPKDKALEEKAKQAEAAKRKAEQDRVANVRAENCRRAQEARNSLASGMPLAKVDEKGKQVMLDDATRAAELKRAEEIIASDCGPMPKQ